MVKGKFAKTLKSLKILWNWLWLQIQKNVGNQGGNAGNQGGNLSITVEMRYNSNENDNIKDWREIVFLFLLLIFKR